MNDWLFSALVDASENGTLENCTVLMSKSDLYEYGVDRLLRDAALGGHLEVCKWAAEQGATRFVWALCNAAAGGHLEVCKWAAEQGAREFNQVLCNAAEEGHLEVCKWAVEHGANDFDRAALFVTSQEVKQYLDSMRI